MANYDFRLDFPIAKDTEREVAQIFCKKYDMYFVSECNNADYDVMLSTQDGKKLTVEIKEDFTCERTGNVGVEFECRGKLSGISISKADIYAYKIHEPNGSVSLYVTATDTLKEMIADKRYFRIVVGGDVGSNSKNYLFKLDVIKKYFKFVTFISG